MSTSATTAGGDGASADPTSPSIAAHHCTVLQYALGLASPACFDVPPSEEEHHHHQLAHSNIFLYLHSAAATTAAFAHHTTAQHRHVFVDLAPGLLSFVVGIIGPGLVFLCVQHQIWRGELRLEDDFLGLLGAGGRGDHNDRTTMKNEKRRKDMLEKRLRDYTHTVEESDIIRPSCSRSRATTGTCVVGDDEPSSCTSTGSYVGPMDIRECHDLRSCEECCQSSLLVPKPGRTNSDDGPKREVQSLCCICLGDYRRGQKIVWSPNRACCHLFHESCAMPWLVRTHRCPMCRQSFT